MKKIKFIVLIVAVFFVFGINVAHAEEMVGEPIIEDVLLEDEVDEPIDNPVDEVVEDEVSFREMLDAFLDDWLMIILATFGGAGGTSIALFIAKSFLRKIAEKVEESAKNNKESNETLASAQETFASGLNAIEIKIDDFTEKYTKKIEGTTKHMEQCINEIDILKTDNAKFKEVIALLVTSNPQFASSGYATKILEALDEGCGRNE